MTNKHQCGSCLGLNREKIFEAPCATKGMLPNAKACNSFKPDLYALAQPEATFNDLELLGPALAKMSLSQLAILSALAERERVTRKYGYRFFQRVYVRYVGPASNNYLSNFMSARVLDCDAQYIRLVGDSDFKAYIVLQHTKGQTSSLYTTADFAVLRAEMVANKKFVDPTLRTGNKLAPSSARGRVANLDELVPDTVEVKSRNLRKKKSEDDLVSLVSRMNSNMYGTRQARENREVEINWTA